MKKLPFILFILLCCVATAAGPIINSYRFASGGAGGPDVWYDVETVANTDTDNAASVNATEWASVTVGAAGSATKARIYASAAIGSGNIKMALYNSTGSTVLASGVVAYTAADDGVYKEVTFSVPAAVAGSTTYIIAWSVDVADIYFRYKAGGVTWNSKLSQTYASFPFTPIGTPDFTFARGFAVSLYVD